MRGRVDARVARGASVLVVGLVGCAAAERGLSPVPPAASIPVAPLPSSEPIVTIEPRPALTESAQSDASSAQPRGDQSPATAAEPESPGASALVSIVDEAPFHSHAEATASAAPIPRRAKQRGHHHRPYHPAPGIIVDLADAQGSAPAADMQRIARNMGYWPFRRCYEEGLRRDQGLGGKVALEILVGSDGAVERIAVSAATVTDATVVTCVAREALHLSLAPGESATEAKMVVTLAVGDEPVPVARPVPGADDLRVALRQSWPAVEQCYASALSKHPDAGGRLELRFRVDPRGEVAEVAEGAVGLGDVDLARCVLGVYRATRLPPLRATPHDGTFVYAMHFEPRSSVLPVGAPGAVGTATVGER
jgi:hypothetical protein